MQPLTHDIAGIVLHFVSSALPAAERETGLSDRAVPKYNVPSSARPSA